VPAVNHEQTIADTLAIILNVAGFDGRAIYSGLMAVEMAKPLSRNASASLRILLSSENLLEKARAQNFGFQVLTKPVHPADLLVRPRSPK
jgi:hypothetical protein